MRWLVILGLVVTVAAEAAPPARTMYTTGLQRFESGSYKGTSSATSVRLADGRMLTKASSTSSGKGLQADVRTVTLRKADGSMRTRAYTTSERRLFGGLFRIVGKSRADAQVSARGVVSQKIVSNQRYLALGKVRIPFGHFLTKQQVSDLENHR